MGEVSRRRLFFGGAATLLAAPAIVRVAADLMPVSTNAAAFLRPQARTWFRVQSSLDGGKSWEDQYRAEFIRGFEERMSQLRATVTTDAYRGSDGLFVPAVAA